MPTLVPLRGKILKPLPVGASVVYRFTLSGIPSPDPSTWTTLRFSVCKNDGTAYFTVPLSDMTVAVSGTSGDYSAVIDVPVTEANSRLITSLGDRSWQLDFVSSGGYQDVLVDGTVFVFSPYAALP